MEKQFYRQGDVGVLKVESLPADVVKISKANSPKVLAHGEKTGHNHRFETNAAVLYKSGDDTYLEVSKESKLLHQEHDAITFEPGVYKIIGQVEYHPQEIRRVVD